MGARFWFEDGTRGLVISDYSGIVRTRSPRGYRIGQCANLRKLGESVPDFIGSPVANEHLLHEQVEKVFFLCGWDGAGRRVASGTYFNRLEAGEYLEAKRVALSK